VRRLAILLVTLMLVLSIGIAAVLSSQQTDDQVSQPSGRPPSVQPGSSQPLPTESPSAPAGFAFGPANTPSPAVSGAQSRLWVNDGAWWGVFLTRVTADQRIFRLDATTLTWIDTGVVVDDRPSARMDVVWDGRRLVVASAGPSPNERHALRITRFRYDAEAGEYRRDANYPVTITAGGVDEVTVARAPDGRLWVAYSLAGQLVVDHSLDSDLMWRGPFVPDLVTGAVDAAVIASVGSSIALVWAPASGDAVHIAWHDAAGGEDVWVSGTPAPVPGLGWGDDEFGLAVDGSPGVERLFIGVRTSASEDPGRDRLDPHVVLIEFRRDAEPVSYLLARIQDELGAPTLVIDADARQIHALMPAPASGGAINLKTASLDSLQFATGPGAPFIQPSNPVLALRAPTSTKQSLDRESGMVLAAADPAAGQWGFGSLSVTPTVSEPPPGSDDRELLANYTFNGLAPGDDPPGWELDGEPVPAFTIVHLTGSNSSARLSSTTTDARACARFTPVEADILRAGASALFNASSSGDMKFVQLRGQGGEAASIRLREGEVVYADGDTRVRTELLLAPGRWYRATLSLDRASRTFGVQIADVADDELLLQDAGLRWTTEVEAVDQVCAEVSPQPGLELYLDDVRVRSSGGG
jgi:hypothetical protein